jgi:hypothetical protein
MITKQDKRKIYLILTFFSGLIFLFSSIYLYQTLYVGDYKIDQIYFSSTDSRGIEYCDNCLWIVFYEGCNRYKTYYFENQHELDDRLYIGQPVNIKFNNGFIRHIQPAKRYRSKC